MKNRFSRRSVAAPLVVCARASVAAYAGGEDETTSAPETAPMFAEPVRLMSAGAPISTEEPGYASPAWYDVNGDGRSDLIVGQFKDGKMRAYPQAEDGSFGEGAWIMTGEEAAEVPGVW